MSDYTAEVNYYDWREVTRQRTSRDRLYYAVLRGINTPDNDEE